MRTIAPLILIIAGFAVALPAGAQTGATSSRDVSTTTEARTNTAPATRSRLDAFQAERVRFENARRTAADTPARREIRPETETRVKNAITSIVDRFIAVVDRLADLIARIESHIAALDARGADTSEAKRHIAAAQDALADVRALLAATDAADVDVVLAAASPRETALGLREKLRSIHARIVDAREAIRQALRAL